MSTITWLGFDSLELATEIQKSLLMTCTFIYLSIHHKTFLTDPTSSSLVFFFFFFQPIVHCDWLMHTVWLVLMRPEKAYAEACGKVSSLCLHNAPELYPDVVKSVSPPFNFSFLWPNGIFQSYSNCRQWDNSHLSIPCLTLTKQIFYCIWSKIFIKVLLIECHKYNLQPLSKSA